VTTTKDQLKRMFLHLEDLYDNHLEGVDLRGTTDDIIEAHSKSSDEGREFVEAALALSEKAGWGRDGVARMLRGDLPERDWPVLIRAAGEMLDEYEASK